MAQIHPTALISKKAKLGENVSVGSYSIVDDDVEIGDNTYIGSNSVIYNGTRIGNNVTILNSASVSHIPQDKKFHNEYSLLYIGDNSLICDFTTLHRGTEVTGKTIIGENVTIAQYSHVAHDCIICNSVFIGSFVQIGGHVEIDEFSVMEDFSSVHQFCKLGKFITVQSTCKVSMDIPPFVIVGGKPIRFLGLNSELFEKYSFTQKKIDSINQIYATLYYSGLNFSQAKEKLKNTFTDDEIAIEVLEFLAKSTRGIVGK
jgi:UDP-N-acetylglucosamine acyltransferase